MEILNCPGHELCNQPCNDDPVDLEPIDPTEVIRIREGNAMTCYNLEGLYMALAEDNINPTTRTRFTQPQLDVISERYRTRYEETDDYKERHGGKKAPDLDANKQRPMPPMTLEQLRAMFGSDERHAEQPTYEQPRELIVHDIDDFFHRRADEFKRVTFDTDLPIRPDLWRHVSNMESLNVIQPQDSYAWLRDPQRHCPNFARLHLTLRHTHDLPTLPVMANLFIVSIEFVDTYPITPRDLQLLQRAFPEAKVILQHVQANASTLNWRNQNFPDCIFL